MCARDASREHGCSAVACGTLRRSSRASSHVARRACARWSKLFVCDTRCIPARVMRATAIVACAAGGRGSRASSTRLRRALTQPRRTASRSSRSSACVLWTPKRRRTAARAPASRYLAFATFDFLTKIRYAGGERWKHDDRLRDFLGHAARAGRGRSRGTPKRETTIMYKFTSHDESDATRGWRIGRIAVKTGDRRCGLTSRTTEIAEGLNYNAQYTRAETNGEINGTVATRLLRSEYGASRKWVIISRP